MPDPPAPLFDMADLERAVEIVRPHVPVTPTYAWPLLAADLGTEVWVKHENTTPTGAFKMRGGLVLVERLARERPTSPASSARRVATTARAWRSPVGSTACR